MIFDKIENLNLYNEIPQEVKDFLLTLSPNIKAGRNDIKSGVYANIDVYNTKPFKDTKMEAHREYIDIQLLLHGVERLDYTNIAGLRVLEEYNQQRDVIFFDEPEHANSVLLDGTNFVMLYPHEAHRPQISHDSKGGSVTKVVVKIKVD